MYFFRNNFSTLINERASATTKWTVRNNQCSSEKKNIMKLGPQAFKKHGLVESSSIKF